MRKLFAGIVCRPKHAKVQEKTVVNRLILTVVAVLACLAAMGVTAYAYFSCSITSRLNNIQAAHFEAKISVRDDNGAAVAVETRDPMSYIAALEGGKTYRVTLEHGEQSTAKTGFVILTANGCENGYHTQQLVRDEDGKTRSVSFFLTPDGDTEVTFLPHWGTSSYYPGYRESGENSQLYILDGETVILSIEESSNEKEEEKDTPENEQPDADADSTTSATEQTEETTLPQQEDEQSEPLGTEEGVL